MRLVNHDAGIHLAREHGARDVVEHYLDGLDLGALDPQEQRRGREPADEDVVLLREPRAEKAATKSHALHRGTRSPGGPVDFPATGLRGCSSKEDRIISVPPIVTAVASFPPITVF